MEEQTYKIEQELKGTFFGRWEVQDRYIKARKGERKLLCRCECGTERYVLERALKSGGSLSCGCLRREHSSSSNAYELTGKTFGNLIVLGKAANKGKQGGVWWDCRCSCGNTYTVPATLLVTGKRTHCGCQSRPKGQLGKDISGKRFGRLCAQCATPRRDAKGSVVWHCQCACGEEAEVTYNDLVYGGVKSCGCQKKEHEQRLHQYLTHMDGTSIDMLKSRKLPVNNTTGVKGVYAVKGRYMAKIVFQKKQYFLGNYETLEEAAAARKEAERLLNDVVIAHYELWKQQAVRDPVWAEENPVRIQVERDGEQRLSVTCFPTLDGLQII